MVIGRVDVNEQDAGMDVERDNISLESGSTCSTYTTREMSISELNVVPDLRITDIPPAAAVRWIPLQLLVLS